MSSDEERLYDPIDADLEDDLAVIDATATSPPVSNNNHNNNEEETNTTSPLNSEVKHRWFILEPAVFLVFLAMYLSSKYFIYILFSIIQQISIQFTCS